MSRISIMHLLKLVFRSCLFLAATVVYMINRLQNTEHIFIRAEHQPLILFIVWAVFVVEMILRFFPSSFESMGCQKQFKRNFQPKENAIHTKTLNRGIGWVILFWIVLNGGIGALYYAGCIDEGILVLISLFYSVCDMICILFFCPFQTWMMKNKCCTSCRIYNWDYAMMFTPLIFVENIFAWSILFFAVVLLVRWEITAYTHPKRFSEETNACLSCAHCEEKLCHHKKQLRHFWAANKKRLYPFGNKKEE